MHAESGVWGEPEPKARVKRYRRQGSGVLKRHLDVAQFPLEDGRIY